MSTVQVVDDVCGNGRKKVLLIGITGSGKSSLCNALTGSNFSNGEFTIGHDPKACTRETKFGEAFFCGDRTRPFTIVDTIGFADPDLESDQEVIIELVNTLKNFCDHINAIIIVINGGNARLDAGLIAIIKIFEGIFTKEIWNHVCIVFSHIPMDIKSVKTRKIKKNKTDAEYGRDMIKKINEKFPDSVGLLTRCFFIDCTYDREDNEESNEFEKSTELLHTFYDSKPGLSTTKVTIVETENVALKRKLEEDRTATEELKKAIEDLQKCSEAEKAEIRKQMETQMADSAKEKAEIMAKLKMLEENNLRGLVGAQRANPSFLESLIGGLGGMLGTGLGGLLGTGLGGIGKGLKSIGGGFKKLRF